MRKDFQKLATKLAKVCLNLLEEAEDEPVVESSEDESSSGSIHSDEAQESDEEDESEPDSSPETEAAEDEEEDEVEEELEKETDKVPESPSSPNTSGADYVGKILGDESRALMPVVNTKTIDVSGAITTRRMLLTGEYRVREGQKSGPSQVLGVALGNLVMQSELGEDG